MWQLFTSFEEKRTRPALSAGMPLDRSQRGSFATCRIVALCAIGLIGLGCNRTSTNATASATGQSADQRTALAQVIAQGQLMPAGGLIQLGAQPGDVAQEIKVAVGQEVQAGESLVVMRSKQVLEARRAMLHQQRSEAQREQKNAIAMAQRQAEAAALKKRHAESQQASLDRKSDLLQLAKAQVETSQHILSQLENISKQKMTSEFVGSLEIDRQRLVADEARLAFMQQQETHVQLKEDLAWALEAAEVEFESARAILQSAQESEAVKIIDLQIAALELEDAASEIVAPEPGVILTVNITKGESSLQLPIIEMANTSEMVCEVEINEMDAAWVRAGQMAEIRSRAFEKPLVGEVLKKYSMVGRPQLRSLDPLARVDYRAVTATILLDARSAEIAKEWLQLQVEVAIRVDAGSSETLTPTLVE